MHKSKSKNNNCYILGETNETYLPQNTRLYFLDYNDIYTKVQFAKSAELNNCLVIKWIIFNQWIINLKFFPGYLKWHPKRCIVQT
jgi:hypothetical protein